MPPRNRPWPTEAVGVCRRFPQWVDKRAVTAACGEWNGRYADVPPDGIGALLVRWDREACECAGSADGLYSEGAAWAIAKCAKELHAVALAAEQKVTP
jgi:hypothetical protein